MCQECCSKEIRENMKAQAFFKYIFRDESGGEGKREVDGDGGRWSDVE